ncbi:dihydrofolate reductase [Asanoa ferruginea]|uniref:Dihydrofolate reductase n=1 Tax=Asanoa ferruginea TaxID=53367 RepID=A0A3D9ZVT6_9ACTN|nr:dihydrofolate reductase family protein [Asanoa ferruginea]REG01292.1 dihydrofolate reductase [Asanoa ferruginea]GIF51481.1 riboflavin biosynthesis protein RibD [Asanoa ferruginea]
MRNLVALVFNYSLDGLIADEGTDFWKFCFELLDEQGGPDDDEETIDLLQNASAHVMGRTAYEGMAANLPGRDDPWARILNAGHKVVFSETLPTPAWANTTVVSGDTTAEIGKLRQGGDGHIVVWGGVRLWRSLMRLDLIDEWRLSMYPYVTGVGTRLFDADPKSYRLDLVSSMGKSNGILELHYRRHRP